MDPGTLILMNTIGLLAIAVVQAYTAYLARDTRDVAIETRNVAKQTEVNTNSLVAKVEAAAKAEGVREATATGVATAATLKRGQEEGRGQQQVRSVEHGKKPLPVEDEAAAVIAERVADATEKGAEAQIRVAEATEKRKP